MNSVGKTAPAPLTGTVQWIHSVVASEHDLITLWSQHVLMEIHIGAFTVPPASTRKDTMLIIILTRHIIEVGAASSVSGTFTD